MDDLDAALVAHADHADHADHAELVTAALVSYGVAQTMAEPVTDDTSRTRAITPPARKPTRRKQHGSHPAAPTAAAKAAPAQIDVTPFRRVMGQFATGVTVLTSATEEGPFGMTVNAFASLSLEPPLVMVGFSLSSRTYVATIRSRRFALNILSVDQQAISQQFASKAEESVKFRGVSYALHHGVPILDGSLAWVICEVEAFYPGGDHMIGVGRVIALHRASRESTERAPLVFWGGRYVQAVPV